MKINFKKHLLGYIAIAIVFTMVGASFTLLSYGRGGATAETQRLATKLEGEVTSPFTAAIAAVSGSVVGISNYTTANYGNFGGFGGFGGGFNLPGQGQDSGDGQQVEQASGSGVVISDQGHVLTNYHVVEGNTSLKVTTPDKSYDAELIAYDEDLDIAIVQAKDLKLNPVTLGDSDTLKVGDWAIAIGNPLGTELAGTTTVGIVSALNREVTSYTTDRYGRQVVDNVNTMIQVDAAINSGNSGGGMFNVLGELMGIPSLKYTGSIFSGNVVEGIGMCIPINTAKPLIEDVLSGKVTGNQTGSSATNDNPRPRLGVTVSTLNQSNNQAVADGKLPAGVYVSEVEDNSPAKLAGIGVDDIIVEIDGQRMTTTTEMISYLGEKKEGDVVKVKVYRVPDLHTYQNVNDIPDGEYKDFDVTLAILDQVNQ
jgi:serine protease Do